MIPREMHVFCEVVVQVGESNPVLGTNRLTDYNFVDIAEFIPIFFVRGCVFHQRLSEKIFP